MSGHVKMCLKITKHVFICLDNIQTMPRHILEIAILLSMELLNSIGHNNQNEVKLDSLYM